jgi:hypothetical protein
LVINDELLKQLGVAVIDTRNVNVAGGGKRVIPLEFMDLMVDPVNRELVGVHGD